MKSNPDYKQIRHYAEVGLEIRFAGNQQTASSIFLVLQRLGHERGLSTKVIEGNSGVEFPIDSLATSFDSEFGIDTFLWDSYLLAVSGGVPKARGTSLTLQGPQTEWRHVDRWVAAFSDSPFFLQAFAFDGEFDFLQNATTVAAYHVANKSLDGVVVRNLGLPSPHHTLCEVDTSFNPGRRPSHFVDGVVWNEYVGAKMWFAESFWPLIGKTKSTFLLDPTLGKLDDVGHGVLKITARGTPFDSATQREHMDSLRQAIYGISAPDLPKSIETKSWIQAVTKFVN